jgi:hypothetical protein
VTVVSLPGRRAGLEVGVRGSPARKQVDGLPRIASLNLVTANLEIRPASDDDLATLVEDLGERHWFTDRLARQQRGGGVLLVAWLEDRPVGEVFPVARTGVAVAQRRLGLSSSATTSTTDRALPSPAGQWWAWAGLMGGAPPGTRTPNRCLKRALLCQLS